MREILFRGKRADNGEWKYGYYATVVVNGELRSAIDTVFNNRFVMPTIVCPETVGQFTGMYDRNGKKIFEGDIIAFRSSESIYEVAYDITDSKFILLRNGKDSFLRFYNISAYYFSVIANKWDSPELL